VLRNDGQASLGSRMIVGILSRSQHPARRHHGLPRRSAVGGGAPDAVSRRAQTPSTQSKPNILFILVDNLGYGELGVYGGGRDNAVHRRRRIDKARERGPAPHQT